ncbi:MAG: hypothetical protein A3K19_07525 [Lentisphaerae bacterium RIFOXYB12_FULL_65_16]|nr:MAG: hypothetical protein A3K18_21730 [Lentisphaerae bacterium RIFOXYA12_64_32]OGV93390.1 MAG: hypothetical protein A3K19_07525 [Lentisphaerae bacterium RIFOXYB12_FULL_65_16]
MDIRCEIDKSSQIPIYRQIAACLRQSILAQAGTSEGGSDPAIPTERELSLRFGVQRGTVRRALDELLDERLLYRIRGAGTFVNRAGLTAGRTRIEIVATSGELESVTNPFSWFLFYDMLRGATAGADKLGCHCHLLGAAERTAGAADALEALQPGACMGVIFIVYRGHERAVERLQSRGIACVVADGMKKDIHLNRIFTDREKGTALAMEHLLRLGHRRIALLNGPLTESYFQDRYNGYERTLRLNGIPPIPERVLECGGHVADGAAAMGRALVQCPDVTAVVAATDLRAIGAMQAIRAAGRRIPQDISVIGYHDSKAAMEQAPQLTTVRLPAYEMGRQAVQLLRALLSRDIVAPTGREVPAELVLRETTGRVPGHGARAPRRPRKASRP